MDGVMLVHDGNDEMHLILEQRKFWFVSHNSFVCSR
jgi:hypothetical protein